MPSDNDASNPHDPVHGLTDAQKQYRDALGPAFDKAAAGQPEPAAEQVTQQAESMTQHAPAGPAMGGAPAYKMAGVRSDHALSDATAGYAPPQGLSGEAERLEAEIEAELDQSGGFMQRETSQGLERDQEAQLEGEIEAEMDESGEFSEQTAGREKAAQLEAQIEAEIGDDQSFEAENTQDLEQASEMDNEPPR